ncbi:hypothetical protein Tco_0080552 [Tanacetum coccineum]
MLDDTEPSTSPSRFTSSSSPTPSQSPQPSPTQPSPTQPSPTQPSPTQLSPSNSTITPSPKPHTYLSHLFTLIHGSDEGSFETSRID